MAKPCGASKTRSLWCSRRCVFTARWSSPGSVPPVWSENYRGPFYRWPWHLCTTHTAVYLNLASAAGAKAIHGHIGTKVVTMTRGAGDDCAHRN